MLMRKLALAGVALLAVAGGVARAEDFSREEIEQIVNDYIMNNPKIVMDAAQKYQRVERERQTEAANARIQALGDALTHDPAAPVVGNANGDVTIVEFFDYQCGYCKTMLPTVQAVLDEDKNVRLVMKEFPILSEVSTTAAKAALAAKRQGKYWELHSALMALKGRLSEEQLFDIAAGLGLDIEKLKADMASDEIAAELDQNHAMAKDLGISGTPAFIIGGEFLPGAIPADQLKEKIKAARDG